MEQHRDLPQTSAAPGIARRMVRDLLLDAAAPHVIDDALLVASELATNAVRYGAEPMSMHAVIEGTSLIIAVQDALASDLPYPKVLTQTEPDGRGMHLVAAMTSRWGWDRTVDSKVVWAEIPLDQE